MNTRHARQIRAGVVLAQQHMARGLRTIEAGKVLGIPEEVIARGFLLMSESETRGKPRLTRHAYTELFTRDNARYDAREAAQ